MATIAQPALALRVTACPRYGHSHSAVHVRHVSGRMRTVPRSTNTAFTDKNGRRWQVLGPEDSMPKSVMDGSVIALNGVSAGSALRVTGDIVVLASTEGELHAGARGDARARIIAAHFRGSAVTVAGHEMDAEQLSTWAGKAVAVQTSQGACSQAGKQAALAIEGGQHAAAALAECIATALQAQTQAQIDAKPVSAGRSQQGVGDASRRVCLNTGCYALALGTALMLAPHTIFRLLFDTASVSRGFVRLGGALLALFGSYYAAASRPSGLRLLLWATVWGRTALVALCCVLLATQEVGAGILFFAAANGLGAFALCQTLQQEARAEAAAVAEAARPPGW